MARAGNMDTIAEPQAQSPFKARPEELEDGLNRTIYHPLSRRLALILQHSPITPNMVSVTSGLSIAAAAYCYTSVAGATGVLVGLFLHILWHVFDGADGDLARLTGKTSPLGEMIDGLADYLGHVILYTALAWHVGGWIWFAAFAAAGSRILQANHIESVRRTYLWRAYGVPWLRQSKERVAERPGLTGIALGGLARLYVWLAGKLIPHSARTDAMVEQLDADPASRDRVRSVSRQVGRRALAYQAWLGPNRRTLLLGLSMALGSPLWFFLWEATILNLLLALSVRRQREVNAGLHDALVAQ
ncbi:CDP-alcohol phosphatidyltransferase family protein [Sphingosinicella sp. BN140058]|uniref:CDP-alcohol phosphatidyltransferase family protein n=1 Tax=Sphingosinicella sp. BN140058 TaxID=1892855 RepID=UPI00101068EE|nr:CDP-alcohol phosphatidyltransferase family protein [Sphingosinicella sp. BN140058]QAY78256.1 CDP-alcohol phosphatidyltransferase family protein [Sphingosinicella sp. BN140058]